MASAVLRPEGRAAGGFLGAWTERLLLFLLEQASVQLEPLLEGVVELLYRGRVHVQKGVVVHVVKRKVKRDLKVLFAVSLAREPRRLLD